MEAIEKLKQIGIKRINQDTKISVSVIENILEKRFDKIQRVWIVGFLPILEREYNVDLKEWLEEYDTYLFENQQKNIDDAYQIRELELDTQKQKYDSFKRSIFRDSAKQVFYTCLGVFLVAVIYTSFKFYNSFKNASGEYDVVEKPLSSEIEESQGIYTNLGFQQIDGKKEIDIDKLVADNEIEVKDGEVLIIPRGELWFQVLNLETRQKQDRTIRDPYLLKMPAQKSVIIFGHKGFELKYKDRTQKYDGGDPIRFVIQDNTLKYVRYADYLKLLGVQKKDEQATKQEALTSDNADEVQDEKQQEQQGDLD
ncbi:MULTISPECIES: hypothetical protein [unclassified Helicobacter]|uniref:hypothetical protein n=1 Tax=unclassified Helicobacter TaxID=2593540 RepID=UPI000CF14E9A|nr:MULTISPECIES: hypothetical protein [unclassified Helicobacter]